MVTRPGVDLREEKTLFASHLMYILELLRSFVALIRNRDYSKDSGILSSLFVLVLISGASGSAAVPPQGPQAFKISQTKVLC